MTTDQFKINLRNLRLKVGDKIMLKWMSPVIDTSVHIVTEELLQWITIDEKRSSVGILSNLIEDEDEAIELTTRIFELGGKTHTSYQGKMPIRTIPLIVKNPRDKREEYLEEIALAHIIEISLFS